jgi:putative transposase
VDTWSWIVYVAVLADVYSRAIACCSAATHKRAKLVTDALQRRYGGATTTGIPRGRAWCTTPTPGRVHREGLPPSLRRLSVTQSMGRPGSALDNAVIEAWHLTLEFELRRVEQFATKAAVRGRVAPWIDDYNRHRRHSALSTMSPVDYERALAAGQAA